MKKDLKRYIETCAMQTREEHHANDERKPVTTTGTRQTRTTLEHGHALEASRRGLLVRAETSLYRDHRVEKTCPPKG